VKRIAVLGTGLVGRTIAGDLVTEQTFAVTAWDRSEEALECLPRTENLVTRRADLSRSDELRRAVAEADVVVVAVPGFLGAAVLRGAIEASKPVVDISFAPEDPLALADLARARGVPAVVDCGVAPGLSNLLVGSSAAEMDDVIEATILVGGLPARRVWPWEYRAVFSPTDVIEEYTRPSRFRCNGFEVVRPALSDVELVDLPEVGTLEAFNTDGLRTLLRTIPARTIREKTLRYPGHAEKVRLLRDAGFFREEALQVGDVRVAPRALTEKLLFASWALPRGEEELTVLRVEVTGRKGGGERHDVWNLLDRTDRATGNTSMARTTGFPCALVARMLADGTWAEPGVHPPEILGRHSGITARILAGLEKRGVRVRRETTGS